MGMMSVETLADCLRDFQSRFNANEQVKKLVRGWDRSILLEATDSDAIFTVTLQGLLITDVKARNETDPDDDNLVHLQASEENLIRILSGDYQPATALIDGELAVFSSEPDKVKLEAISIVIWGM
jgi:putative sterol carrier protein